jgi:hypothetical protein
MTENEDRDEVEHGQTEEQHGNKAHAAFIEGLHGKHGGSLESEGAPQEQAPEAGQPAEGPGRRREEGQQPDEAEKRRER